MRSSIASERRPVAAQFDAAAVLYFLFDTSKRRADRKQAKADLLEMLKGVGIVKHKLVEAKDCGTKPREFDFFFLSPAPVDGS